MSATAMGVGSPAYMGEPHLQTPDWLTAPIAALIAAGCTAFGAFLASVVGSLRKPSSSAELITAATEAARVVVADLRLDVGLLRNRVGELETQNQECRGENRQLWQHITSLENILRQAGLDIPARELPNTFVVIERDRTTVLKPKPPKGGA